MKALIYFVQSELNGDTELFYQWDDVINFMESRQCYRATQFIAVSYPAPKTGLIYCDNPTDRAIHRNPKYTPDIPKAGERFYFGELDNYENLPIRDTPIPYPYTGYYVNIESFDGYYCYVLEIEVNKLITYQPFITSNIISHPVP